MRQLSIFHNGGSFAALLERTVHEGVRLPPIRKAKWCYQLASAVAHVHFQASSWHEDIKPPNMLLDDSNNLLLINWEHCGTNAFVLAPAADGSFDIDVDKSDECHLVYVSYNGPKRVNMPIGAPRWNVFPAWQKSFPRAVELAEVYSLGRTMWLILEQVARDPTELEEYASQVMGCSDQSKDILPSWKQVIAHCTHRDPNHRIIRDEGTGGILGARMEIYTGS